jgi:hypothetical protein
MLITLVLVIATTLHEHYLRCFRGNTDITHVGGIAAARFRALLNLHPKTLDVPMDLSNTAQGLILD